MDNRKIGYFLKVCETGSMSKAARSYYISQQALSKSIESLEQELGVPLFIRTQAGLQLTEYGLFLRNGSMDLIKREDELTLRLAEMRRERRSSFSISYFNGMMSLYPDRFFEKLVEDYPDTIFHFYSYQDDEHGRLFANTNVDLLFSTVSLQLPEMEKLFESHAHMCVLVDQSHPLAARGSIVLEDLRSEYIIALNSDSASLNLLRKAFAPRGIIFHSVLGFSDQSMQSCLIHNQHAVSFYAGPEGLRPPGTVMLELSDFSLEWPAYIYRRSGPVSEEGSRIISAILSANGASEVRERLA